MKNTMIKKLILISLLMMSQPLWAGCESSILEGGHTALIKKEAKLGAWEDAKEVCYPGEATKLNLQCMKVKGDKGVEGKDAIRCVQEVSCNICGDDLMRKYEATN
jgi:hypothetical protein